jgi:carbamate kinase
MHRAVFVGQVRSVYRADSSHPGHALHGVVAVGGNSLIMDKNRKTIPDQFDAVKETSRHLADMIEEGWEMVITHGNGPQVGNLLMQNALAREVVPDLPLDVLVAQTEGSLGYILQQELLNELRRHDVRKSVVTMITQVVVDADDPAFRQPSKPVGPFYAKAEIEALQQRFPSWQVAEDAGRGYRRIVPSPFPQRIVQSPMIRSLAYAGNIVLALGGGGVPIAKDSHDQYVGVEAVIDKDFSSALLANDIKADLFVLLCLGADGSYNVAYGLDWIWRVRGDDYFTLQWAQTFKDGQTNRAFDLDSARLAVMWERRTNKGFGTQVRFSRTGMYQSRLVRVGGSAADAARVAGSSVRS